MWTSLGWTLFCLLKSVQYSLFGKVVGENSIFWKCFHPLVGFKIWYLKRIRFIYLENCLLGIWENQAAVCSRPEIKNLKWEICHKGGSNGRAYARLGRAIAPSSVPCRSLGEKFSKVKLGHFKHWASRTLGPTLSSFLCSWKTESLAFSKIINK